MLLCLIITAIAIQSSVIINTDLGYSINETIYIENKNLSNCITVTIGELQDSAIIEEKVLKNALIFLNGVEKTSYGDMTKIIYPEFNKVCWKIPITITTKNKTIIYTDTDKLDAFNKRKYDFDLRKWV